MGVFFDWKRREPKKDSWPTRPKRDDPEPGGRWQLCRFCGCRPCVAQCPAWKSDHRAVVEED